MLLAALLAAAAPQSCTLDSAQPTTVREVAAAPDKWLGRCVRIQGYSEGYVLYQDVAGSYRHDASDREDRRNDGWLGLEFRRKRAYRRPPFKAQVVGRVHDCRGGRAASEVGTRPGRFVIAYGSRYCHDHGGLLLRDATIRHADPAALPRQTGERARLEFGDLLTVEEAGAPPEEPVALLRRFVAAIRSGDAAAAAALAGSYNRQVRAGAAGAAGWRSFIAAEGPLAFLGGGPVREPTYFRARMSRHDALKGETPHWFACFCATPDCEGRWPIAVKDAAVDADPSYACVRLHRGSAPAGSWAIGIVTRKPWSFAERD